jgi:prevent-host-death family protein
MADAFSLTEAPARFGALVRRASHARERVTITDRGEPMAVLISPQELADLEDDLAIARYRLRQASGGAVLVSHEEARSRLGMD